jgi:formylglycine-generating enzyme required for sulfatase activity
VLAGGIVVASAPQASPGSYHERIPGSVVSFEMVRVPAGPAPIVTGGATTMADVAAFAIGRHEVTWDMFDVFALELDSPSGNREADAVARPSNPYGAPDRGWGHAGFPAMSVSKHAAETFCRWLSIKTGTAYRLPTDAEWSRAAYVASAGSASLSADRRAAVAWFSSNADGRVHRVGARAADALGLFDLFGNVAEWVATADGRSVTRGGSFRDEADDVGPLARAVQDPTWNQTDPQLPKSRWWLSDGPFVGFRLATSRLH